MKTEVPKLVLASRSPRRAALLRQIGFAFDVKHAEVPEHVDPDADPEETVLRLSAAKAEAVLPGVKKGLVIGADTVVVLDGELLGKPADAAEASEMLRKLSGKTHRVFTGFTLIDAESGSRHAGIERTDVTFRALEPWEIEGYVSSGAPMDKAGAYGIQDRSGLFVERIEGCFYNVVGFPLTKFYEGLKILWGAEALRGALQP